RNSGTNGNSQLGHVCTSWKPAITVRVRRWLPHCVVRRTPPPMALSAEAFLVIRCIGRFHNEDAGSLWRFQARGVLYSTKGCELKFPIGEGLPGLPRRHRKAGGGWHL